MHSIDIEFKQSLEKGHFEIYKASFGGCQIEK